MRPVNSSESTIDLSPTPSTSRKSPTGIPVDFSPPLIAMVVIAFTAFLIVTYFRLISRHLIPPILNHLRRFRHQWRRWRHRIRRRRSYDPSESDLQSFQSNNFFESAVTTTTAFHFFSSYGLDEEVIKTIPLSIYTTEGNKKGFFGSIHHYDCAVCLLEFEDNDYVRTLPVCAHAFHVDCIDEWLRSHANCPLCRAGIFRPESPFIPLMAARIRPSLDDGVLESILIEARSVTETESYTTAAEIIPSVEESSPRRTEIDERLNRRDFLLKRSYSFGFERNLASDRLGMEAATASPWRYRRGSFWSKRPSPFSSLSKHRVFSFRYYRGTKSPFFRRRGGLFPLSESNVRYSGGGSSRRSKSMTSPIFMRSSAAMAFSSSRLRCGDLEALLSPERLNRR